MIDDRCLHMGNLYVESRVLFSWTIQATQWQTRESIRTRYLIITGFVVVVSLALTSFKSALVSLAWVPALEYSVVTVTPLINNAELIGKLSFWLFQPHFLLTFDI